MDAKERIENLIRRLYGELGNDPSDIAQIKPIDGGWGTALSYRVFRGDKAEAVVRRRDIDDQNEMNIKEALRHFQ